MVNRRDFIKKAGYGALAVAAATTDPFHGHTASAKEQKKEKPVSAGEKVNIALIGVGNRGQQNAQEIIRTGMANVVALCDVDMGAKHTQWTISKFPDVPRYQDFRKMFDEMRGKIEAVFVSTPDFSHFPIAMRAIKEGIHVYCEKPLCRTFYENQLLIDAALKYNKVVTQMGNQGHSGENYFQFKALVESGVLKNVSKINAHMNNSRRWHGYDVNMKHFPTGETAPETLDWDVWQMQTSNHDYSAQFHGGNWRS